MTSNFKRRASHLRPAAFTLIEVMVVVVVIGVLSAAVLPSLGGPLTKRRLSGAAGDLHLAVRHLQEVAVLNRRTCRLLLQPASDGEAGRYAAEFAEVELDAESAFSTLKDAALPTTTLPAGVRFGTFSWPPTPTRLRACPAAARRCVSLPTERPTRRCCR